MSGRIFLFIAVVAFTASINVHGHYADSGANPLRFEAEAEAPPASGPQKCCITNKQYSAKLTALNTINSDKINVMDMQVDFDRQKQVMLNYTGSKEPENKVLIDYVKRMLYSVPTKDPTSCLKIPYTMPLTQCIPDDADYLGSSYLGPVGAGQLPYDAWRFNLKEYLITIAVTKESCVPVVEGVSSPLAGSQLFVFSGYQPKLTDPSAFDLPESCNQ